MPAGSTPTAGISIAEQADELLSTLAELTSELAVERDALSRRDSDELAASGARKLQLIERIDSTCRRLPAPLRDLVAQASPQERPKLDAVHKKLLSLAREAQEYNLVNGRIIARSQQSTRELLASLTGTAPQDTYGATGQPDKPSQGNAIARA